MSGLFSGFGVCTVSGGRLPTLAGQPLDNGLVLSSIIITARLRVHRQKKEIENWRVAVHCKT